MKANRGTVGHNDPVDNDDGFTERVLMSMIVDISQLAEGVERIKIQVFALAMERGIATDVA